MPPKDGQQQGGKPEEKKPEEKKPSRIKQMDTTASGIRAYLDKAAEKTKESFHAGSSLKRALITFAADCAGLEGEERAQFAKQMDSTPGWFGCGNNSACRQAFEAKKGVESMKEYTDY